MRRRSFLPRVRDPIIQQHNSDWYAHHGCQDYAFPLPSSAQQRGRGRRSPWSAGDLLNDFSPVHQEVADSVNDGSGDSVLRLVAVVENGLMWLTGRSYARTVESKEHRILTQLEPFLSQSDSDRSDWWAVYTKHQHEKTVAEMLTGKGFEVFLPLHETMRRWKDRQKLLSLPLFPCYVFVRGDVTRRLQVATTPGIHMILSRGEQIQAVPELEIDAIRRAVQGSYRIEPYPFLKVGERVRVIRGSLEGVEGILVRKKNLFRLVLSVDMLAQSVGVEVAAADVEPVETIAVGA
jgi:transcription antitermination factor NusG